MQKNTNNHEYYSNAETCRNRWFDYYDEDPQNEDYHLSVTTPDGNLKRSQCKSPKGKR